jgi:hypothetical protein
MLDALTVLTDERHGLFSSGLLGAITNPPHHFLLHDEVRNIEPGMADCPATATNDQPCPSDLLTQTEGPGAGGLFATPHASEVTGDISTKCDSGLTAATT